VPVHGGRLAQLVFHGDLYRLASCKHDRRPRRRERAGRISIRWSEIIFETVTEPGIAVQIDAFALSHCQAKVTQRLGRNRGRFR